MDDGPADTQEQAIGRHLPSFVVTTPTVFEAAPGGGDSALPVVVARNGGLLQCPYCDVCRASLREYIASVAVFPNPGQLSSCLRCHSSSAGPTV
jgi:hypothetical protein